MVNEDDKQANGGDAEETIVGKPIQHEVRDMSLEVPDDLRYTLGRQLGRGGMGEVREGHDQTLNRAVAVKVLLPDLARQDSTAIERFTQASEMMSKLDHPSILPIYDRGRLPNDGGRFYAMKLVKRPTFKEILKKKYYLDPKFPESLYEVLSILIDASKALGYAHQRGIVHRDVKPDNIMIDEHGIVLVIDWGLAKTVDDDDLHLTSTDAGAPPLMVPVVKLV